MGSYIHISQRVIVVFALCFWKSESIVSAEVSNHDMGPSEDTSQNYFFYQQSEYSRDCSEALQGCSSSNSSGVYVIKPYGYPEPFEVYCTNDVSSSGWTVIQRRIDSWVSFNRLWDDYKHGFGFLSNNYWIGNHKLSYLTNQAVYELRLDIELSDRSSVYVTYSGFRIGDEWGNYSLLSVGNYGISGGGSFTFCPRNMVFGNCVCQGTCEVPGGSSGCHSDCTLGTEGCFCPAGFLMDGNDCVPPSECPCFWSEVNMLIPNNEFHVNGDCTEKRHCTGNQLVRVEDYQCDSNAQCTTQDNVRQCICNDGYNGDGQNCTAPEVFTDCYDVYRTGVTEDGVYTIHPTGWAGSPFDVLCDMSNGGGWTVFQRRTGSDRQTDFYRGWTNYQNGFGPLTGSFWLGNEKLHHLTQQRGYKLRVDIVTSGNSAKHAEYSSFEIADGSDKYRLTVSGYSGNAGNGMSGAFGRAFSTHDRDNDGSSNFNCAEKHRGAWWYDYRGFYDYSRCDRFNYGSYHPYCTLSNLNGQYSGGNGQNIYWNSYTNCNLNSAEMKIRPSI